MQYFSDFENILIHAANCYGKDKLPFDERIQFMKENGRNLRSMIDSADDKPMFTRSILEIERVLRGEQTSLPIEFDATASGLQMLAIMAGCHTTAENVGLVNPNVRADVYNYGIGHMNSYLPESLHIGGQGGLVRDDFKDAFMPHFYFSKREPKLIFGNKTPEHIAFLKSAYDLAPGAHAVMEDIFGAMVHRGRHETTEYKWTMPDHHTCLTRVFVKEDAKVELEELKNKNGNSSTFTHRMEINAPKEDDVSLVANVTHGTDGFVVREMKGRMEHNKADCLKVVEVGQGCRVTDRTKMVSIYEVDRILRMGDKYDGDDNTIALTLEIIDKIMNNPWARMYTIHDAFKTLAPYCNQMRQYYVDICASMSESQFLESILRELYGIPNLKHTKEGCGIALAEKIRGSNYAIC